MTIYAKKSIFTLYIILCGGATIIFGIAALTNFKTAATYWAVSLVFFICTIPLYLFINNIKVGKDGITIKKEKGFRVKRIFIGFNEISYIQEINSDGIVKEEFFCDDKFSIYIKGREALKVFRPDGFHYTTKDLRKLFVYLEKNHNIQYRIIVRQRKSFSN